MLLGSIGRSHLMVDAIGLNCGIQKVSEDKTMRSPLVVGVWRAQVYWVDYAWRVFCYSYTPVEVGRVWLELPSPIILLNQIQAVLGNPIQLGL